MSHDDWTDMGGLRETFLTTHWSQVGEAQREGDRDGVLIGLLLQRYWKPVYSFLRRKGYPNEKAKDLTQGFFCDVVLDRDLIQRADPATGSFRALLLHALRQFLVDAHRKEGAARQIPAEKLLSIHWTDAPDLPDCAPTLDPEESFNYAWKADLLDRALAEVKARFVKRSMETHWRAFDDRVLRPAVRAEKQPSLKDICARLGIENEVRASHMIETVKRSLHKTLAQHVRQTVRAGDDVADELRDIVKFFKKESEI